MKLLQKVNFFKSGSWISHINSWLAAREQSCKAKMSDCQSIIRSKYLAKYLPQPEQLRQDISFSIIMPTYNRKDIVGKSIDSVLQQTYQNFELIIVDDGSTDNTKDFIQKQYAKELKSGKIKYIYKENSGVCPTRNVGLQHAKNEWITYIDSDNLLFPNFLEVFVRNIQKHKNKTFYAEWKTMNKGKIFSNKFDYNKLLKANFIDLGVFAHHRSVYEKLGGFDENMTRLVDWDLIATYTKKYVPYFIPVPVMLYNDIDDHVRITNSANYYKNLRYFKKKHCNLDLLTVTTMITSYNHEKYIAEAIESAVKQRGDFIHEIIISDDASTDRTPKIIAEYAAKHPHLIRNISSTKNVGISANMKRCFEAATGEYIAVLEGDDYWIDNHKLEKQMNFLDKNKDCPMVFSRVKVYNENDNTMRLLEKQEGLSSKLTGEDFIKDLSLIINFSCTMFRRKYLLNMPEVIYEKRLSEISLALYLEKMGKIGYISTPLSVYRQNNGGVWSGASRLDKLKQGLASRQTVMKVCAPKYKKALQKIIDEHYIKAITKLETKERGDNAVKDKSANGAIKAPTVSENKNNERKKVVIADKKAIKEAKKTVPYKDYFFSVVVTCHNRENLIKRNLDSLINQTYKNFEVIVADDGSTDNSVEVIKGYVKKYPFIKLYQHQNAESKGLPETVLLGIQKAKGQYIAFCECNDYWTKDHLQEVNQKINEEEKVQIIVNDVELIGDAKSCDDVAEMFSNRKRAIIRDDGVISENRFAIRNYILGFSACCVRSGLLRTCNFLDVPQNTAFDWWLWRQVCCQNKIFYIDKKLTYFRIDAGIKKAIKKHHNSTELLDKLTYIRNYGGLQSIDARNYAEDIMESYGDCKRNIASVAQGNVKNLKILYVTTTGQNARPILDPSSRYRCYHPAEVLSKRGAYVAVVSTSEFLKSPSLDYDMYVFHRPNKSCVDIISKLKHLHKILIADYDDLIFGLPDIALNCSAYKNGRLSEQQAFKVFQNNLEALFLFDYFTVSTESLAGEVIRAKRNARVAVVHNFIPESIRKIAELKQIQNQPKDPNLIMYCTGSLSHNKDFEVAEDSLLKALDTNPYLKLVVLGLLSASDKLGKHPRVYFHQLVDYWDLFSHMATAGFTIAPLENSYFNDCKSNVKFLESAVAGSTLITSPIPDMKRMNGVRILLPQTANDWDKVLSELDKVNLEENARCNYDYLIKNCGAESFVSELSQLFKNMEV